MRVSKVEACGRNKSKVFLEEGFAFVLYRAEVSEIKAEAETEMQALEAEEAEKARHTRWKKDRPCCSG